MNEYVHGYADDTKVLIMVDVSCLFEKNGIILILLLSAMKKQLVQAIKEVF